MITQFGGTACRVRKIFDTQNHTLIRARFVVLFLGLLISSVLNAAEPVYPLKTSADKIYLVDQKNEPFLMQGDAAWSLIVEASESEVNEYLNNRRQKGFNTPCGNLIEHRFSKHPPLTLTAKHPLRHRAISPRPTRNILPTRTE